MQVKTTISLEEAGRRQAQLDHLLDQISKGQVPPKHDSVACKIVAVGNRNVLAASVRTAANEKRSKYHGEISRKSDNSVDIAAEIAKHPDFLWMRVKAIESDESNQNGDYFSKDEIRKSYATFEGCPVFTNHENGDVEKAKGKVVMAEFDEADGSVYCTMYIDRKAHPHLARAIEEGYVTDVSMGTQVEYSTCSVCEKRAVTADEYCSHIKTLKGRSYNGKKVYEKNYGLKFIEISVVTDGACEDCTIREIIDPQDFVKNSESIQKAAAAIENKITNGLKQNISTLEIKAASKHEMQEAVSVSALAVGNAVKSFRNALKLAAMTKDGSQAEVQKLNQAMDLLEDVTRTMLSQRQYIDLEFMQKVAEVLADLQHVTDELVDQGYGSVGEGQQQQQHSLPPIPEEGGKEPAMLLENQAVSKAAPAGVGKITEPAVANSSAYKTLLASRIEDLYSKAQKIYGEHQISLGGNGKVNKFEDTIKKLAQIWENPSVRKFKTEVADAEGKCRIIIGEEEIVGTYNGEKVASLKVASLDPDIREALTDNPAKIGQEFVKALETKVASMPKLAEAAPVKTQDQLQQTMEAQLQEQKLPLHPRQEKVRESTTEKQLSETWEGYEFNSRTEKAKDVITEKQLKKGEGDFVNSKQHEEPRSEVQDKQLRDKGIAGNTNMASDEVQEQAHEGQLNEWRKTDKTFNPEHEITEKQLAKDGEPLGRRLASVSSRDDASKAIEMGLKAFAKTSKATGATPEELIAATSDFVASPENTLRAVSAAKKLDTVQAAAQRKQILSRAQFHGAQQTSMNGVCSYLLGSLADSGLDANFGIKILGEIVASKNSSKKIAEAIASYTEKAKPVAASVDFIKEALADTTEDINVILSKEEIKSNPDNKEAFANEAFNIAIKEANVRGIKVLEKVAIRTQNNEIEVLMRGTPVKGKISQVAETKVTASSEQKQVEARKVARQALISQAQAMPGGGMPAAPAGAPMGGDPGAAAMGAPPAGGAAPAAEPAPVANLAGDTGPAADEGGSEGEDDSSGEALPPGSICPACGSDDVDVKSGEFNCNKCGAEGEIEVEIKVTTWPDVIQEKGPTENKEEEEGEEEGELELPGAGLPQVGVAASYKITPELVKKAGNKPVGSFCPHCGSGDVKLASKKGSVSAACNDCQGHYSAELMANKADPSQLYAVISWKDLGIEKLAKKEHAAKNKLASKSRKLEAALRSKNLTAKFAKADLAGKSDIIAALHDEGLLD